MRIRNRRAVWGLAGLVVALLPIGMTVAVMNAFAQRTPPAPGPRVVAAWASGPMEVRIAFDRAVDPALAAALPNRISRFGPTHDAPRGESRPGGDGGSVRVAAARLDDAGRTLVLVTDPHPRETTYLLTVDPIKPPGDPGAGRSEIVHYTLAGVEASWTADGADQPAWSGWWPELDPAAVRAALAGSGEHDRLWPLLRRPGKLALRTFVPLPAGPTAATIAGNGAFEATLGTESARADAAHRAALKVEATGEPIELAATVATTADGPEPTLRWTVAPAGAPPDAARPLPASAFGLAWAPPPLPIPGPSAIPETLATGGDPARGAVVFAGEQAKCAHCHNVRNQGGHVGPDLSNLSATSRAWIYHNIIEPSAAIHPDFVAYTVVFKDGRVGMGVVRAEGADTIRVGDIDARFTSYPRAEVEEIRPSTSSIMPVGLLGAIGEDQARDLLAFLTSPIQPPAVNPVANPAQAP